MRKRTLYFITVAALFLSANIFVSNVLSQTKPFTMGQILRAIASINMVSDRDKKAHYSDILNAIRQRKVDFSLTKENEKLLRDEGATDEFIEVVRKNSPPLIAPTPIPTSLSTSVLNANKEKSENVSNLPNISGDYSVTIEIPGQPSSGTLILTQQGEILTGSIQTFFGTDSIKEGKVTPEGFSFKVPIGFQGQSFEVFVKGTASGDKINGTIESPQGAPIPFSGTKNLSKTQSSASTPIQPQMPKPEYSTYLEAGNKYFDEFNFDRAIEEYNKVLELDSQNVNALIQRGYARDYIANSDFDFADYNSAIKINPNLASESNMLCVFYDTRTDNADNAIENCNEAIAVKPNFSLFYYKRANAYTEKNNLDQTISDYGKAINFYPNFYSAYINRGRTFTDKEDYEKARADFSKAIEIDPKNAAAYYYRGLIYQKKQTKGSFGFFYAVRNEADYNQFRNDFNKAIELNPKLAGAYYDRGLLLPMFTRILPSILDQALFDFNKVTEIAPTFANAYFGRGIIYRLKGDYNQAITEFTKTIELDPNFAAAYSERGFVYTLKKDCNRAILEFTKGIELDPGLRFAYENRAECYINKKDFNQALKDFDKIIELYPADYRAYQNRASVYEKLGQRNLADQDRKRAKELEKGKKQ